MEKLFSDAQFGTFVFHHMQHNVGSMCKTKRYLKEQWLIKQKVFFSWCLFLILLKFDAKVLLYKVMNK